jgi:hypothetical protein
VGLIVVLPCVVMAQEVAPNVQATTGPSGPLQWTWPDVSLTGLADLRLVAPSGQDSNTNGGLGKLPWGDGRGSPVIPELDQAVLRGSVLLLPDLRLSAEFRYDPMQKTVVDVLDAFVRYRPVSVTRWRWNFRAGAFFPPISLENTGIGWTPEWTLTPSAINAWIGEELRILGAEATVEWRGDIDRFELLAAAFGDNEPAGAAIATYGWTFNNRATGLLDHVRLPDVFSAGGVPYYVDEFRQFDHSVGWYLGATWEREDVGRVALLRYDNEADPNAHDATEFAWHTRFWSLSGSSQIGPVVILAQAMQGATTIEPFAGFVATTNFWAYYVLAGVERGDWRFALRFDQFATSEDSPGPAPNNTEHGVALTTAVTWTPRKGISVVGELLATDYSAAQRTFIGKSPHVVETQAQVALRLSF